MRRLLSTVFILVGMILFGAAAFGVGLYMGNANLLTPTIVSSANQPAQFDVFWQTWDLIQKDFVDRKAMDTTQLVYGAIHGMVEALGDTGHTTFLTPQEKQARERSLSGKFSGIGAELGIRNGQPMIVAAFDDSPAQKAGVKAGDLILKVDGEDVHALSVSEVSAKVRGPANTKVTLTLLRPSTNQTIELTITRGEIIVPVVSWTLVPETQIALIRLSQFNDTANAGMVSAIEAAKAAGAKSWIIDLRNNPGGLLDQAIKVTSQFVSDGDVLLEADSQDKRTPFAVQPGGIATELPLVVLVNPGTASAAEIFAGAIQDHKRGQVVGETTFGTGTVLQPFALKDGSELLLGTRQWLTPNGRVIRKQGIKPDVAVTSPTSTDLLTPNGVQKSTLAEINAGPDHQLQKAIELLVKPQ